MSVRVTAASTPAITTRVVSHVSAVFTTLVARFAVSQRVDSIVAAILVSASDVDVLSAREIGVVNR